MQLNLGTHFQGFLSTRSSVLQVHVRFRKLPGSKRVRISGRLRGWLLRQPSHQHHRDSLKSPVVRHPRPQFTGLRGSFPGGEGGGHCKVFIRNDVFRLNLSDVNASFNYRRTRVVCSTFQNVAAARAGPNPGERKMKTQMTQMCLLVLAVLVFELPVMAQDDGNLKSPVALPQIPAGAGPPVVMLPGRKTETGNSGTSLSNSQFPIQVSADVIPDGTWNGLVTNLTVASSDTAKFSLKTVAGQKFMNGRFGERRLFGRFSIPVQAVLQTSEGEYSVICAGELQLGDDGSGFPSGTTRPFHMTLRLTSAGLSGVYMIAEPSGLYQMGTVSLQ